MKTTFRRQYVATATLKVWPHTYCLDLVQTGPQTFVWREGSFRAAGSPNFRNQAAAVAWATQQGAVIDGQEASR